MNEGHTITWCIGAHRRALWISWLQIAAKYFITTLKVVIFGKDPMMTYHYPRLHAQLSHCISLCLLPFCLQPLLVPLILLLEHMQTHTHTRISFNSALMSVSQRQRLLKFERFLDILAWFQIFLSYFINPKWCRSVSFDILLWPWCSFTKLQRQIVFTKKIQIKFRCQKRK